MKEHQISKAHNFEFGFKFKLLHGQPGGSLLIVKSTTHL